jgi:hypothetical protein
VCDARGAGPYKRIGDGTDVLANLVGRDLDVSLPVVDGLPDCDRLKSPFDHMRARREPAQVDFTAVSEDANRGAALDKASALSSMSRHERSCATAMQEICRSDSVLPAEVDAAAWASVISARPDELAHMNPVDNRYLEKADEILQRRKDGIWRNVFERAPSGDAHGRA